MMVVWNVGAEMISCKHQRNVFTQVEKKQNLWSLAAVYFIAVQYVMTVLLSVGVKKVHGVQIIGMDPQIVNHIIIQAVVKNSSQ